MSLSGAGAAMQRARGVLIRPTLVKRSLARRIALAALAFLAASAAALGSLDAQQAQQAPAAQQGGTVATARALANALAAVNGGGAAASVAPPSATPTPGAGASLPTPPAIARPQQPAAQRGGRAAAPTVRGPAPSRVAGVGAPRGPRASAVGAPAQPVPVAAGNSAASADTMVTRLAPQMDLQVGKGAGGLHLSGTVGIVVMLGLLTLLPTLLLLMTGFTRILIVLQFLRQAIGTQNAPPSQLIAALALLLTGFVMAPTLTRVNQTALQPWLDGKMDQVQMMQTAVVPFREFMLQHTRDHDLQVFLDMSAGPEPKTDADIPLVTLMSAFATSELRTAFQIGFALFLPFIIIDIVVSSVLMSMGMFMLPPAMISLPFKLLLFVLVDGWTLVVQSLVTSFRT